MARVSHCLATGKYSYKRRAYSEIFSSSIDFFGTEACLEASSFYLMVFQILWISARFFVRKLISWQRFFFSLTSFISLGSETKRSERAGYSRDSGEVSLAFGNFGKLDNGEGFLPLFFLPFFALLLMRLLENYRRMVRRGAARRWNSFARLKRTT